MSPQERDEDQQHHDHYVNMQDLTGNLDEPTQEYVLEGDRKELHTVPNMPIRAKVGEEELWAKIDELVISKREEFFVRVETHSEVNEEVKDDRITYFFCSPSEVTTADRLTFSKNRKEHKDATTRKH